MRKQHGSVSGYQLIAKTMYAVHGAGKFCGYTLFRQSFASFLPFVRCRPEEKEPEQKVVHCPRCRFRPDVVVFDGENARAKLF